MKQLRFDVIKEDTLSVNYCHLFNTYWPKYKQWYLHEGESARPTYHECIEALQQYMPELYPLYKKILKLVDADDLQARFLSLWCPPPFYSGCSQLIETKFHSVLVRNYDFPPALCEGSILYSNWLNKKIIAMADCMWGVLDGLNEDGLAVSLAYGGEKLSGKGFGITIVLRYLLQTCVTVADALAVLKKIPVHLDYNIALVDKNKNHATVFVAPGKDTQITAQKASTNHFGEISNRRSQFLTDSQLRLNNLKTMGDEDIQSVKKIVSQFGQSPLYRSHRDYEAGTLYTAAYNPEKGHADYFWPGKHLALSFKDYKEQSVLIHYDQCAERT